MIDDDARRKLAEKPNCGFRCIGTDKEFQCCDKDCARDMIYGLYTREEVGHLTGGSPEMIESLYGKETGFWMPGGCIIGIKLGRWYMPAACLQYDCEVKR